MAKLPTFRPQARVPRALLAAARAGRARAPLLTTATDAIGDRLPYPWQVRLAHQASQQLFPGGGGNGGGGARMLAAAPHHLSSLDGMGLAELQAR